MFGVLLLFTPIFSKLETNSTWHVPDSSDPLLLLDHCLDDKCF